METFLQLVARDLYAKIGNDLSRTAIVFPNKRASLFFNEYLATETDRPLWSPAYVSISELFRQLSPLKSGDPIRLVCELYKVFREETRSEETLDDFYFWGELLISDFDDVDKNLVDADKLFSNLQELKNIMDDYDFLDQEQEEAIRQFFQNFSIEKRTELKAKFISLWDKLGDIYRHYRRNLTELGIAYEGMMYRNVMEQLDTDRLRYDRYVFVGFNVLNRVETRFFQLLQDAGKAMFYWDYDVFYTRLPLEQKPPRKLNIAAQGPVIAILPGSRKDEIRWCAPAFFGAASLLLKQEPRTRFIVPAADEQRKKEILEVLNRFPDVEDNTVLLDGKSHLAMEAADAILVASGTATLEAALYKKPLVVGYAMPALSAMLILSKGQTKWISLPNILAQKTLVPECVQMFCSPEILSSHLLHALEPKRQEYLKEVFSEMHETLLRPTAQLATEAIDQVLKR